MVVDKTTLHVHLKAMPAAARSAVTRILAYRSRISMLWQLFIPFCANWSSSGKQIYFKSRCYCTLQQQKYTRAPAPRAWELARVGCVGRDIPEVKITKCSFMVSAFGWHFGDHSLFGLLWTVRSISSLPLTYCRAPRFVENDPVSPSC